MTGDGPERVKKRTPEVEFPAEAEHQARGPTTGLVALRSKPKPSTPTPAYALTPSQQSERERGGVKRASGSAPSCQWLHPSDSRMGRHWHQVGGRGRDTGWLHEKQRIFGRVSPTMRVCGCAVELNQVLTFSFLDSPPFCRSAGGNDGEAHGRTAVVFHLDALLPPLSLSPAAKPWSREVAPEGDTRRGLQARCRSECVVCG